MVLETLLNIIKVQPRIYSLRAFQTYRKMQNAYIRYQDGAEQFQLSFLFKNANLGFERQFNFSRQLTESVKDFLSRISANIERSVNKSKKRRKKLKEGEGTREDEKLEINLLKNGIPVSGDLACRDILFENGLSLHVLDSEFNVILNAPWVNFITLPTSIMAGFPVYPLKLEVMFADKSECTLYWYKNTAIEKAKKFPTDWIETKSGYFYTPSASDIGCYLKLVCEPRNGNIVGPTSEVVSTNPVEAGPGDCPFELRHAFTRERLEGQKFRVVSYNILAELYADSDVARTQLFPYCPPYAINMDYRKQLILKELLGYNADIICLQEVDSKVFDHDLIPALSSVGYKGVFSKKGGMVSEGVACLFHDSKYKLVSSYNILLSEELKTNPLFSDLWNKIQENEALTTRITERTTCTQYVVLDNINNENERIIIANTHQYFHPNADNIRLLQVGMSLTYLEHIVAEATTENPKRRVSYLFCGDFNSTPEFGVYQLVTTQHIPETCIDWSSNPEENLKGLSLSHSLQLRSACGTPEYTNYTQGFAGCLDYIFYQHNQLEVNQVIPLPSDEELQQHTALPSVVFPSDHVALVVDLSWK